MGLEYALLVWWTPSVKQEGGFPVYYYATILLSYAVHQVGPPPRVAYVLQQNQRCNAVLLHQVALYSMYVACMAFHAKVSDPLIGGTYMTLLNTVTNLGGNWPSTVALWMVDPLTSKECRGAVGQSCSSAAAAEVNHQPGPLVRSPSHADRPAFTPSCSCAPRRAEPAPPRWTATTWSRWCAS